MVNCRRRFINEQLADSERRAATSTTAASRLPTACVRSVSDHSEFVVRRRDTDLSSSSSSSSSPATRLLGRLAPQSSPPVDDVVPPPERLPPTSLRSRKRQQTQTARFRAAAAGDLRRSNSVSGTSAGRSLQNGDEGFADGQTRTPEPSRMSGSESHVGGTCCLCREADSRRVAESESNASSTSDQTRKRSYRVGLNLFNKYVVYVRLAFNPINANCSKLVLFEGSSAPLV